MDANLLCGVLRDMFGARLVSITEAPLNHSKKFTIMGVKRADYTKGMKLTRQHIARGWKISRVESKK